MTNPFIIQALTELKRGICDIDTIKTLRHTSGILLQPVTWSAKLIKARLDIVYVIKIEKVNLLMKPNTQKSVLVFVHTRLNS